MNHQFFIKSVFFGVCFALLASYTTASPYSCRQCKQKEKCLPPACSCCGDHMPIDRTLDVPQMVFFTFDDAITSPVSTFYRNLFDSKRKNPNGCPVKMTLFVSHLNTQYALVREFYRKGMEIGAHSVTHSHMNDSNFRQEAKVQKENIARLADIPISEIKGWRSPFLESLGDLQPSVLKDLKYTYDATLTVDKQDPYKAPLPFTLDYGWPYDCKISVCPQQNHSSFWEVPVVTLKDYKQQFSCVYVDGCNNPPPDEDMAFKFLWDNFRTYYEGNRAPFGINMHASWFFFADRLAGMERFIRELGKLNDVFIVSVSQVIDWLKQPTPLKNIDSFEPWACAESRKIARERRRKLEAQRKALEEKKKLEARRKALEEKRRIEAEQKALEEKHRIEAEQKALEEKHRMKAQQKAWEEKQRIEDQQRALNEKQGIEAQRKRHKFLNDKTQDKAFARHTAYNFLRSPSRMGTPVWMPSSKHRAFGIKFRKIDGNKNLRYRSRPSGLFTFSRPSTDHKLSKTQKDAKGEPRFEKSDVKGHATKTNKIESNLPLYETKVNNKSKTHTDESGSKASKLDSPLVDQPKDNAIDKTKSRGNLDNKIPSDKHTVSPSSETKLRRQKTKTVSSSAPLMKIVQWLRKNMLLMQSHQKSSNNSNSTTQGTNSTRGRSPAVNPKFVKWASAHRPLLNKILVRLAEAIKKNKLNKEKYLVRKDSQNNKSESSSSNKTLFLKKLSTPKLMQVTTTLPYVWTEQQSTTTEIPVVVNDHGPLGQQPPAVPFSDFASSPAEQLYTYTVSKSPQTSMSSQSPMNPIRQEINSRNNKNQQLDVAPIKTIGLNTDPTMVRDSITDALSDVPNTEIAQKNLIKPEVVFDKPPGNLNKSQVPQIIYFTVESKVNFLTYSKIKSLFNKQRTNPNGCRIGGTAFIKTRGTSPRLLQLLHSSGVEIGIMVEGNSNSYQKEVMSKRENLSKGSSIPLSHIRGIRMQNHNMEATRNLSFLANSSFYDASAILSEASWPYTLNSADNSNMSIYEVPIIPVNSAMSPNKCTYADGCPSQPRTRKETFQMLMNNFAVYYKGSRIPFGIHLQQNWFKWSNQHHLAGLSMFLDTVLRNKDVYVLSIQDMLKWMENHTSVNSVNKLPDWKC